LAGLNFGEQVSGTIGRNRQKNYRGAVNSAREYGELPGDTITRLGAVAGLIDSPILNVRNSVSIDDDRTC